MMGGGKRCRVLLGAGACFGVSPFLQMCETNQLNLCFW